MAETLEAKVRRTAPDRIRSSREKVDDYVITASITILGAFVVLLTLREAPSRISAYLGALSIASLVLGLLSALWHKYRAPLREARFEALMVERMYKASDDILEFADTFGIRGGPLSPKVHEQARKTIAAHLQVMGGDLDTIRREVASSPLPERYAKLKHLLDMCAVRVRYSCFAFGMIMFVAAVLAVVIHGRFTTP